MPTRINGIGTGYYGRTNVSARNGRCELCNRDATLTSYDTREWFSVFFIPLIPLTKYRIMEQCSSCRRHRRLEQKQFQQQLDEQIAPLRAAIQANPSDALAHEKLILALTGFRMSNEAETAGRAAVAALPQSSILNRLTGNLLWSKGDLGGAAAFLRRATNIDPTDRAARASLGSVLYYERNFTEAAKQLEEARRLAPDDRAVIYTLGDCYVQLQRWNDALAAFQSLGGSEKLVLRRIGECKKQLGYELTPAERKASRRWWPFGGKGGPKAVKPATARATSEVRPKVVFAVLIAVFVVGIGGAIAWGVYKSRNIDVYFDSAIPKTTFNVDGRTFTPDAPPMNHALSPGRHHVIVTANGKTIETRDIDVEGKSIATSIFSHRAYVYNTGALRVYKRASIDYAANERDAGYREELIALKPFFEIDHLDYIFEPPPQTVELSSGQSKTTKHAFMKTGLTLLQYAQMRLQEENIAEAEKALRVFTKFEPCDVDGRGLLVALRGIQKADDEAIAIAREGITACASDPIPYHRLYQETKRRLGRDEEVRAEYRAALDAHANSAMYHYLYGRLLVGPDAAIPEHRIALTLDPKLGWAHGALAYELMLSEAYADAAHEYAEALKTKQHDDATLLYYTYAAIAAGELGEAHAIVDPATRKISSESEWYSKWLLNLAEGKWLAAKQMYDADTKDGMSPEAWLVGAQLYKASGDGDAYAKHLAMADKVTELHHVAAQARFYDAIESGEWSAAVQHLDAMPEHDNEYILRLYAAAATMMRGDAQGAAAQLDALAKAETADTAVDPISRRMLASLASALTTGDEATVVRAMHDDPTKLNDAFFLLGARAMAHGDRAHAKQLFAHSAASSFDLTFPMRAAQRLASL